MHVLGFVGRGKMKSPLTKHPNSKQKLYMFVIIIFIGFSESMVKYYMGANFLNFNRKIFVNMSSISAEDVTVFEIY